MSQDNVGKVVCPLPPELANLPTIEAEPWLQVGSDPTMALEGPVFDRAGTLFFTSPTHGIVFYMDSEKQVHTIFSQKGVRVDGTAFHKDGRLFIACLTGELLSMNSDGSDVNFMYPTYWKKPRHPNEVGKPLYPNDLVFDAKGNIYITDCSGASPLNPVDGVFRVSSDATVVEPVALNMASPNGISLSPEGNILWVGETSRNTICRIGLLEDGVTLAPPTGVAYTYYGTGMGGPDGNKVDGEGNLYQVIICQGLVIVFNKYAVPIATVTAPGREAGENLFTGNLAFKPGTKEVYLTGGGGRIFKFTGLAEGLKLYSHQD